MRFELADNCETVSFVVAYAPTECAKDAELKRYFWQKMDDLVRTDANERGLFVLMDGCECGTGRRLVGCGDDESRVLGE